MRMLLDTHAFLWFVAGEDRFSPETRDLIADVSNEVFLSIVSVWEIDRSASSSSSIRPGYHCSSSKRTTPPGLVRSSHAVL